MNRGGLLLVRADASAQIGSGHIMRCLALAQAWKEYGGRAIFLMAPGVPTLASRVCSEGFEVELLQAEPGSLGDAAETGSLARRQDPAWLALDGYHFSAAYCRALRPELANLLLFDDLGDADYACADLVLNQNAYARPEMYNGRPSNGRLLIGSRFTLLRREFWSWRGQAREVASKVSNVLVTFGGGDSENVTAKVLRALSLVPSWNVRVMVGSSNPHHNELRLLAASLQQSIDLRSESTRMADEMAWADLAISAGGSTTWELAFMGVPAALLVQTANQCGTADYVHRHGVAINLGWHYQISPTGIAQALCQLGENRASRQSMSARGRDLLDGYGGQRVVEAMTS